MKKGLKTTLAALMAAAMVAGVAAPAMGGPFGGRGGSDGGYYQGNFMRGGRGCGKQSSGSYTGVWDLSKMTYQPSDGSSYKSKPYCGKNFKSCNSQFGFRGGGPFYKGGWPGGFGWPGGYGPWGGGGPWGGSPN